MSAPTIPISDASRQVLQELAQQTGQTPTEILDKALDQYRRKLFFDGLAADYAALKTDPEGWAEELEERKQLEGTLMDGLDTDERWTEDGGCLNNEPPSEKSA